MSMGGN